MGSSPFQAKFTDDGSSIIVSFSQEGSASSGLLDASDPSSGGGPGSCTALFDGSTVSAIGDGAICECRPIRILALQRGLLLTADKSNVDHSDSRASNTSGTIYRRRVQVAAADMYHHR